MSSESNTERLVDLMYGESTDQEKKRFLEEIAESSALQRERDEIRTLLGDVSEVWAEQSVSSTLHNSIMDAAKSAVNERAEKKQFVTPIKPPGLWSRLRHSGQIGQIAMVATVVIAGAFVFRFVNLDDAPNVHEEMSVSLPEIGDAAPKLANKPMPVETEKKEAFGGKKDALIADSKVAADEGTLNRKNDDLAEEKTPRKEKEVAQKARPKKKSTRSAGQPKTKKRQKNQKTNISSSKSSAPSKGQVQNKAYFDDLSGKSAAPQAEDEYQKRVESAEELKLVPTKTIDTVSSKYGARDYSGTIQAADEFVGLKSGTRTERARALQLKAQSLANLGRYQEALRVYDSILKNYKTFQSSAISSARAEISRKIEERQPAQKKRKAKSKSEKSYDFESDSIKSQ